MQRAWRIGVIVLVVLIGAGIGGVEYLNRVVLPVKGRAWAENALSQALSRKVSIGNVRAHFWYGIILENVTIQEDARYGASPFLHVEQI